MSAEHGFAYGCERLVESVADGCDELPFPSSRSASENGQLHARLTLAAGSRSAGQSG
jgi:hypothetical protein